jgi:hypothetical protein
MQEIQQKIDSEISKIKKDFSNENILIQSQKIKHLNIIEYQIDISFPNNSSDEDYDFTLEINVYEEKIRLYSKTIPALSDGRDILFLLNNIIINENNNNSQNNNEINNLITSKTFFSDIKLSPIIPLLKKLILSLNKIDNRLAKFYLDEQYDLSLINSLNYIKKYKLRKIEMINNRKIEIPILLTISDEYFCIYEYLNKNKNKILLIFYSSLRTLVSFKKSLYGNVITLFWITNNKNINLEIKLTSINDSVSNKIVDDLIEKIKKIGFKMDITKHKEGKLPEININKTLKEILQFETQMKYSGNVLIFNKLLSNYEKAVEYFSAINDKRYEMYTGKIQELLSNEKYSKFIDV